MLTNDLRKIVFKGIGQWEKKEWKKNCIRLNFDVLHENVIEIQSFGKNGYFYKIELTYPTIKIMIKRKNTTKVAYYIGILY